MNDNSFNDEEDFEFEEFTPAFPMKNDTSIDNQQSDNEEKLSTENVLDDKYKIVGITEEEKKEETIFTSLNDENNVDITIKKESTLKDYKDQFLTWVTKYSRVLPVIAFVFVSALGIYIFVNNVKADVVNLIKIEEKSKVGYISSEGDVVVKPKYLYGTDYYKGFAVVKNYNNLYGMLDGKGRLEIPFGNIFSSTLYGNRYVVSKFTNEGLKMGLLDTNLQEVTRFKYDNISYSKSGIFLFSRDETMGLMNKDGKEIYTYKVDEVDDKNISIEVSNLEGKSTSDLYAKLKINNSSTIINTSTGKEVYKYTLDDIKVLDNNVFYIKREDKNNRYFIIKDDKVVYETSEYLRVRVEDLDSNIAIGIKSDTTQDYINLLNRKKINESDSIDYKYSDGVILSEAYNFNTNKTEYTIKNSEKILGTFYDFEPVDSTYVNGYMKIVTENKKYTFIDKKGNIITKREYDYISDFSENGYAIISNDSVYGLIDGKGKEIIGPKYDEIIMLDDDLFKNIKKLINQELFIYKDSNKYGIINSKGKVVVKAIYSGFDIVTTKYPIIKAVYNSDTILLNVDSLKDITIKDKDNIEIYSNYIIVSGKYYNYNGDLIYSIGG